MFASGVGRIFREFDEFLDLTYARRAQQNAMETALWKKKNRKKLTNLLENFLEETVCLLNIDRSDFAVGELPWGFIFYNRMLSAKNLVTADRRALYQESFCDYEEYFKEGKPKDLKKKAPYIHSIKSLVLYLRTHYVDPDNVLIGLTPSLRIMERYQDWLLLPADHREQASTLMQKEGHTDPLSLYFVGFPAKKGDLVLAQVPPEAVGMRDCRTLGSKSKLNSNVVIFARIKDAVDFKKKTFLTIWVAPKEEKELYVPAELCVPLRKLVPGKSWIGDSLQMREMVAELSDELESYLHFELAGDLQNALKEFNAPVVDVYEGTREQPYSFLTFHSLRRLYPILNAFVHGMNPISFPQMGDLKLRFIAEAAAKTQAELDKLLAQINDPDGNSNKLFMVTSDRDILKLQGLDPQAFVQEFLTQLMETTVKAIEATESDRRELINGNLKNQLSKWWLLLIDTRAQLILAQTEYDGSAWNEDTYIDGPPANLEGVKKNLAVVQDILNPKHPANEIVAAATDDIKSEVYPVIDDFILKAHVVLSFDLLGRELGPEYQPDQFDSGSILEAFKSKKEEILAQENGEEVYKQFDGLIKDLKYLVEMKTLEFQSVADRAAATGGKLALSYAVPLSGLMMGSFFRLENILKTVLELWQPRTQAPTPPPSPSHSLEEAKLIEIPDLVSETEPESTLQIPTNGSEEEPVSGRSRRRTSRNTLGDTPSSSPRIKSHRKASRTLIGESNSTDSSPRSKTSRKSHKVSSSSSVNSDKPRRRKTRASASETNEAIEASETKGESEEVTTLEERTPSTPVEDLIESNEVSLYSEV